MQRIVFLVDPKELDTVALEFACYLSKLTHSKLTAVFLQLEHELSRSEMFTPRAGTSEMLLHVIDNKKAINQFCSNHGLSRLPEVVDVSSLEEIITETRFADVLIVSPAAALAPDHEPISGDLVTYLLKHAECPVMIAPLNFTEIDEVVFAYDGSTSSVFAIKQFTNLFPEFEDKRILFLEVNKDGSHEIHFKEKMIDYLKMHYSSIGYHVLHGNPDDELFAYFIGKRRVLIVIGAFGRNTVSTFFRKSTADLLLKTTSLPVFITHK